MIFKILLLVLFLLAVFFVARPILKRLKQRKLESALRENPPESVRFLVKLPPDSSETNQMMTRFWDRIHRHLPNDEKSIQENTNTVHAAIVGEGAGPGVAPKVFFLVWCHPSIADRVQLDLVECYNGEVQMITVDDRKDPLGRWTNLYRKHLDYQTQLATQAEASDASETSDDD